MPLPESFYQRTDVRDDLPEHIQNLYAIGAERPNDYWPFQADGDTVRRMIALNYGAITMTDDQIGEVMAVLNPLERPRIRSRFSYPTTETTWGIMALY